MGHKSPLHTHGGTGTNAQSAPVFEGKMQERMQQDEAAGLLKKESLGTQTINGLVAEGTRTTAAQSRQDRSEMKGSAGGFRAVVFDGSSDCAEEHADRSTIWNHDVHGDQHSTDRTCG